MRESSERASTGTRETTAQQHTILSKKSDRDTEKMAKRKHAKGAVDSTQTNPTDIAAIHSAEDSSSGEDNEVP